MSRERFQRAREIFDQAGELEPAERKAFLDQACGTDAALRAEVEALLAHDQAPHEALRESTSSGGLANAPERDLMERLRALGQGESEAETGPPTATGTAPVATPPPERIGPYKILETLGEGGMGTVYLAEQTEPIRRRVALKIIKLGMDTRAVIARFEAERQALALMSHPNVAKVLDAGTTEQGRPYFVMEHVPGIRITDYCDKHRLSSTERLQLLMQVCHGIQHAHQKGIIHRDIKPSNVLVSVEGDQAVPKVIDFGVAKATEQRLTERTVFTEQGQLIGTPEYMSPEQAEMTALDIDTRTDVYSLGVLLYELLVGRLPLDSRSLRGGSFGDIQRMIREQEPPKPSTRFHGLSGEDAGTAAEQRHTDRAALQRQLRGDLDWITMKAMEKDRMRRYAAASELADDIVRHLKHEAIRARPPSALYKTRKFVRRNRGVMAAVVAVFLTLVTGLVGTTVQYFGAEDARAEAEQRTTELEEVTQFQQRMLGDVKAEAVGRAIIDKIRGRVQARLADRALGEQQAAGMLAGFDDEISAINSTDVALEVIDEHILARAAETIEEQFADQPLVQAALQQSVGDTYRALGLLTAALPLQESALAIRRRELGEDNAKTARSVNNMGLLMHAMGKLDQAESRYREALEVRRRILGAEHADTLISLNNLGMVLKDADELEQAEPCLREALAVRIRVLGEDDPDTLQAYNNLGLLLTALDKFEEAEPYQRAALEGGLRVLGEDHPDTVTWIGNMGYLLLEMGRPEEAEPYYLQALEGRRRLLGADHPRTLTSLNNMGYLLQTMGRFEEAEPYYREVLEKGPGAWGEDHPNTLTTLRNLGMLLKKMGKPGEAEAYYREALEGQRRVLGSERRQTLKTMAGLGEVLVELRRFEEAEDFLRECGATSQRVFAEDDWRHWHAQVLLATALLGQARALAASGTVAAIAEFSEAELLLTQACERLSPPPNQARVKTEAFDAIIALYEAWDAAEPGRGHARQAEAWRKRRAFEEQDVASED